VSPWKGEKYPRVQLLAIEEILAGKDVERPRLEDRTFKKAQEPIGQEGQKDLFGHLEPDEGAAA
jgi:hypothetical protein